MNENKGQIINETKKLEHKSHTIEDKNKKCGYVDYAESLK